MSGGTNIAAPWRLAAVERCPTGCALSVAMIQLRHWDERLLFGVDNLFFVIALLLNVRG